MNYVLFQREPIGSVIDVQTANSDTPKDQVLSRSSIATNYYRRILRFFSSPEFLLFTYFVSVVLTFKPLLYFAVVLSLIGMNWRISTGRTIVYTVISLAMIVFFATPDRIMATLVCLIVPLGIFCAPQVKKLPRVEQRFALWGAFALIVYCNFFTSSFDPNDGVVSHNFIGVIGIYMLMLCTSWRRVEFLLLCFGLTVMVGTVGSRSGSTVFLMIGLWIVSPRTAIFIALTGALLFFSGFTIDALPTQFTRPNYEGGIDPRFVIWSEFLDHALMGSLFRREDFYFMAAFGFDRNFHNSVFEAYYRMGPFVIVLLALHLRLLRSVRDDRVAFVVFVALFGKGLFDTYLWFTPIDLLIFREYGSRLFGIRKFRTQRLSRNPRSTETC